MPDDKPDRWVEHLLTDSRPAPGTRFERDLERRLLADLAPRRWSLLRRPVVAGAATTAGLALAFLGAGLLGGGPLSPDGQQPVEAEPTCRWVEVTRQQRVRRIVVDARGEPRVVTVTESVTRPVRRCR